VLEANGSWIDTPAPILVKAGEQVTFSVELTLTPWHYEPSKVSTKLR
jgi:hypothetical protein